jgi:pimeloyl-ACP methyl ester carboxylesterase
VAIRVAAIAVIVLVCAACGGDSPVATRTIPGEPGLAYEVDGEYLYLLCTGRGSPVVVLEAGLGGGHRDWDAVQPELARTTRVCSYDRAGLVFSQLAPNRATATAKAEDLNKLLSAADVDGPYVLVGHSYGGMLAHVFAANHPDEVAGVVLLDSSHPDQRRRSLAALPPRRVGESTVVRDLRRELRVATFPNTEGVDFEASSKQARSAGPLADKPLIVVTAGQDEAPPEWPRDVVRRSRQAWLAMQADLAKLSTNGIHVIALNSPHYIQSNLGQPDLVVRAVHAVAEAVRSDAPLPACGAVFARRGAKCVAGMR